MSDRAMLFSKVPVAAALSAFILVLTACGPSMTTQPMNSSAVSQASNRVVSLSGQPDNPGKQLILHPKSLTFTSPSDGSQKAYVEHDNRLPWFDNCSGIALVHEGPFKRRRHVFSVVVGPIAPGKCNVTFRKHSQVRTLKIIVNG